MITLRELQRTYDDTIFEFSIVIDDIYKYFDLYDIKRSDEGAYRKQMSCTQKVLYELISLFH